MEQPLLMDPEANIPRAIEVVFGSSASRRYGIVKNAFTPDAFYYNTWVGPANVVRVDERMAYTSVCSVLEIGSGSGSERLTEMP